MTNKKRNNN